jgi:hypothetical protein
VADHPSWAWGWPSNSLIFNFFFFKKQKLWGHFGKKKEKEKRLEWLNCNNLEVWGIKCHVLNIGG